MGTKCMGLISVGLKAGMCAAPALHSSSRCSSLHAGAGELLPQGVVPLGLSLHPGAGPTHAPGTLCAVADSEGQSGGGRISVLRGSRSVLLTCAAPGKLIVSARRRGWMCTANGVFGLLPGAASEAGVYQTAAVWVVAFQKCARCVV